MEVCECSVTSLYFSTRCVLKNDTDTVICLNILRRPRYDLVTLGMSTTRVYEVLSCSRLEASMLIKEPTHTRFLRYSEGTDEYKLFSSWRGGRTFERISFTSPNLGVAHDVCVSMNGYTYDRVTKEYVIVRHNVRDDMYKGLHLKAYLPSTFPQRLLEHESLSMSSFVVISREDLYMFSDEEKKVLVENKVLGEPFDVLIAALE